jgi:RNA polymerase sigma-70 factor (ECF subfamily)
VRGCRSGDIDAFDAFVNQFTAVIMRRVSRLAVPASDCADVCQEVLIAAAAQLQSGRFHERAALATWLHHIATGKAIDYHRRRSARDRAVVGARRDARHCTAGREQGALLKEALAILPPRDRLAFVRFYVCGLPVEEIARAMGLSVSRTREILTMTKAQVTRALADRRNWRG